MEKEVRRCPGVQPKDMDRWGGLEEEQVWERKLSLRFGIYSIWDSSYTSNGNVWHESGSVSLQRLGLELWVWEPPIILMAFKAKAWMRSSTEYRGRREKVGGQSPGSSTSRVRTNERVGSKRDWEGLSSEAGEEAREENTLQVRIS